MNILEFAAEPQSVLLQFFFQIKFEFIEMLVFGHAGKLEHPEQNYNIRTNFNTKTQTAYDSEFRMIKLDTNGRQVPPLLCEHCPLVSCKRTGLRKPNTKSKREDIGAQS